MNALDNHQVRFNAKRKTFTFKLKRRILRGNNSICDFFEKKNPLDKKIKLLFCCKYFNTFSRVKSKLWKKKYGFCAVSREYKIFHKLMVFKSHWSRNERQIFPSALLLCVRFIPLNANTTFRFLYFLSLF